MKRWKTYLFWVLAVLVIGTAGLQIVAPKMVTLAVKGWIAAQPNKAAFLEQLDATEVVVELSRHEIERSDPTHLVLQDTETVWRMIEKGVGKRLPYLQKKGSEDRLRPFCSMFFYRDRVCRMVNVFDGAVAIMPLEPDNREESQLFQFDDTALMDYLQECMDDWLNLDELTAVWCGWSVHAQPEDELQPMPEEEWAELNAVVSDLVQHAPLTTPLNQPKEHFVIVAETAQGKTWIDVMPSGNKVQVTGPSWTAHGSLRCYRLPIGENPFARWMEE